MKIFVCIKQVPDTETKLKIDASGKAIDPAGVKWIVNLYDEFAIEEAIKTRDANPGAQVWVVTVGPKTRTGSTTGAAEALRTALAMGADEAILVDGPDQLDPLSTALAATAAIKKHGPADLIFTGKLAIDDGLGAVPQMIAECLDIPHTSVVSKFQMTAEGILVERDIEGGAKEVVQMTLPALVAATKGLNMPRYASLPGIMKAKKKTIHEMTLADAGVTPSALGAVSKMELPAEKPPAQILAGDPAEQAKQLVAKLRDEAKVL